MDAIGDLSVRPLEGTDEPLLRRYLHLAVFVPPGQLPPPVDIVDAPELLRYVEGWGRAGDLGVLALDGEGRDMGAAWVRLWLPGDEGYGFLDRSTPELSLAVRAGWRGRGIGTRLLERLLERVAGEFAAVSLSVSAENPAVRLYRRFGFEVVSTTGGSLTMRKQLDRG